MTIDRLEALDDGVTDLLLVEFATQLGVNPQFLDMGSTSMNARALGEDLRTIITAWPASPTFDPSSEPLDFGRGAAKERTV